jgi:integrase
MTLSRVGEAYLEHLTTFYGRKRATTQDYRIMLRKHLVPFFDDAPVAQITKRQVEGYSVQKRSTLAAATISGHLILLHGVLKYAVEEGLIRTNPVAEARRPPAPRVNKDIRFLTVEEVEALIRKVPDDYFASTDRALYRTAALTGLRQGELVALRWMDVDWQAGRVRVRQAYTRGELGRGKSAHAQRSVPMAPEVAAALDNHFKRSKFQADDDKVFCHPETGHFYDASKLLKRFKKALQAAGVRPVRFHDLRHTFGTQVASRGAPIVAIKDWMGHSNIETTMIYVDWAPDPHGAAWIVNGFAPRNNGSDNCSPAGDDPPNASILPS